LVKDYVTAEYLEELQVEMLKAAQELDFVRAAELRDKISKLKGEPVASPQKKPKGRRRRRGGHAMLGFCKLSKGSGLAFGINEP